MNVSPPIWSVSQLSEQTLPPLHSKLFGGFQVVDCKLEQESPDSTKRQSYIDFAFGSDTGYLAGVHRFSVWRDVRSHDDMVLVEYSDTAFNPTVNKPLMPNVLLQFHLIYAMVLFREGVSKMVQ
ncbi:hypothetical protein K505DRAFT_320243 [Melanomma pulvis-pyrius CBS 109.77]|uniref:Uncharacterized protein n=1 Tax=Melanomma pulvis-pyrius CBS 109.77 TaxID=1314802 RepID=A0A6A6XWR0_9PLEO|nr:hypothetical protein K505DRAFT_320243 [Melanomma pulvis-pyrius CBS 109.77]